MCFYWGDKQTTTTTTRCSREGARTFHGNVDLAKNFLIKYKFQTIVSCVYMLRSVCAQQGSSFAAFTKVCCEQIWLKRSSNGKITKNGEAAKENSNNANIKHTKCIFILINKQKPNIKCKFVVFRHQNQPISARRM